MNHIELYINNQSVDFGEDIKIQLDKVVSEARDPLKKTGTYSLPITLPYTQKNREIFFGEDDKQLLGKFRRAYTAKLIVGNQLLIDGQFLHLKNSAKGFEGAIGEVKIGNPKLGDILAGKKLTEIKSFIPLDFQGTESVTTSWENTVAFPDAEVCYPFVSTSFSEFRQGFTTTYEDLGISHFVAATLTNIFKDAGYTVDGEIFGNSTFQKLVMLYSSSEKQLWNYGVLAPMRSECPSLIFGGGFQGSDVKRIDRQTDYVYVMTYPFQATQGDKCGSMGTDGVYTCKFSGVYTFEVRADHSAQRTSGAAIASDGFTAFRCLSDNEFIPDNLLPPVSGFGTTTAQYLDAGTLKTGNNIFTFTARLEEGKQYTLQRYISVARSVADAAPIFFYNPNSGRLHITSVNAPEQVNPAAFLPDMSQADFVAAVFKIFNLYYQLNADEKAVTLLTRNDFFKETLNDTIDLTPYVHLKSMDELPLTEKEIGQTYLTYASDDSDHILKNTDYLSIVNGDQPDESTKLPFAPLGFIRVQYAIGEGNNPEPVLGEDIIPAILPAQESVDTSVLNDRENFTSTGSWTPRLLLYHGAHWLKDDLSLLPTSSNYMVNIGRSSPGTQDVLGNFYPGAYEYTGLAPKVGFFDVNSQPSYEIVEDTTLRSFTVERATGDTIYSNGGNGSFLLDTSRIPEMDSVSMATNVSSTANPKGFFFGLYSNDLLIGSLSNYVEGVGRMNPVLFTQLTGRQVLRLDNDLFLLESIKNYDLSKELATYKLYKLVANTSQSVTSTERFTSTKSFTATCASGYTGPAVTESATRTSFTNQAAADSAALAAATAAATAKLVCIIDDDGDGDPDPTEWTSTQSFTAECGPSYYSNSYTGTGTYTSYISQADADAQALILAEQDAYNNLNCIPAE